MKSLFNRMRRPSSATTPTSSPQTPRSVITSPTSSAPGTPVAASTPSPGAISGPVGATGTSFLFLKQQRGNETSPSAASSARDTRRSHLHREGKHADGVLLMEVWQMKRMLGSARRQLQTYIDSHADAADLGDLVAIVDELPDYTDQIAVLRTMVDAHQARVASAASASPLPPGATSTPTAAAATAAAAAAATASAAPPPPPPPSPPTAHTDGSTPPSAAAAASAEPGAADAHTAPARRRSSRRASSTLNYSIPSTVATDALPAIPRRRYSQVAPPGLGVNLPPGATLRSGSGSGSTNATTTNNSAATETFIRRASAPHATPARMSATGSNAAAGDGVGGGDTGGSESRGSVPSSRSLPARPSSLRLELARITEEADGDLDSAPANRPRGTSMDEVGGAITSSASATSPEGAAARALSPSDPTRATAGVKRSERRRLSAERARDQLARSAGLAEQEATAAATDKP